MRRFVRRAAVALMAAACITSLSACGAAQTSDTEAASEPISTDGIPVDDAMAKSLISSAAGTLGASDEQLIVQRDLARADGDETYAEIYEQQIEQRETLEGMRSIDVNDAYVVLLDDGSYTAVVPVTFAKGTMDYVLNLNMATSEIRAEFVSAGENAEADTSISGLLKTATVYAVIGIGTVFIVLIVISLIISRFIIIHNMEKKAKEAKAAPAPAPAPKAAPAPAPAANTDDEDEIAAVIAAAIAAAEADLGIPAGPAANNGLVVRSIRRLPKTLR